MKKPQSYHDMIDPPVVASPAPEDPETAGSRVVLVVVVPLTEGVVVEVVVDGPAVVGGVVVDGPAVVGGVVVDGPVVVGVVVVDPPTVVGVVVVVGGGPDATDQENPFGSVASVANVTTTLKKVSATPLEFAHSIPTLYIPAGKVEISNGA